jgi:ParB/RepB/Spo0J family partition protein
MENHSAEIQSIPLDKLIAYPSNPNRMSEQTFKKLVRNIERTGLYEPIVVRKHPKIEGSFEIINGHHRIKAIGELGRKSADCVIWDVDDEQAAILLATLNRLQGSDRLEKKIELLNRLKEYYKVEQLAKLLPQTKKQIEALINLKVPAFPSKADRQLLKALVFFVTDEQLKIIEQALSIAIENVTGDRAAEKKAKALAMICNRFEIRISKSETN